jgi:hypothetical protein
MKLPDKPQRAGFVEEQINEAILRGDFDNPNGKGRPLNLRGDLSKREEMREKLRGDANFGAPWVEVGREIEVATVRVEAELTRAVEFYRRGVASPRADQTKIENDFRSDLKRVDESLRSVNSLVLKHNLLVPFALPHLHRRRLKLESLMENAAPELVGFVDERL